MRSQIRNSQIRSTVIRSLTILAAAATAALYPAPAAAQSAAQAQTQQTPPPPRAVAGQDGFAFESGNGDFRLQIGLLAHIDGRFALDDSASQVTDTFAIRRARPYLRGRLARRFEFYLNPDFAGSSLAVHDAYVDTVFSPAFRLRAGKSKAPFGMERLHSASNLLFLERALPTALVPNRDVGYQVLGDLKGGIVSYSAGIGNGVADGGSADLDTNDGKDVAARIIVRPFRRLQGHPLAGLNFALSGSTGTAGTLPTLRTTTLQQTYFSYAGGQTPAVSDGKRTRFSPQIWYFNGPFGGWAEYVRTETPVRRGEDAADIVKQAWQVAGGWVLSGENATDSGSGVRPRNNFDFANGHWGAFQIAARYQALEIDEQAFTLGFANAGASRKAEGFTIGLRWYLTGNFFYAVNFERTVFDGDPDGPRKAENALAFRTQINF